MTTCYKNEVFRLKTTHLREQSTHHFVFLFLQSSDLAFLHFKNTVWNFELQ